MKKKVFACAMALVMLLSLLPTAALAVEDAPTGPMAVLSVDVLFDEPVAGGAAPAVTVAEDAAYEVYSAVWYNKDGDPVTKLADGQRYYLDIAVAAKEGYVLLEETAAAVNGVPADDYWYDEGEQVPVVRISMDFSFCRQIDVAEIFYDEPVAGEALSAATVPEGAPYTVESAVWTDTYTGAVATEAADGHSYMLAVKLQTAAGYEFSDEVDVLVNGSYDFGGIGWDWTTLEIYDDASLCQPIDEVRIEMVAPVVGQPLPEATAPESVNYTMAYTWWNDRDTGDSVTGTAEDGIAYTATIALKAAEGYKFTDETVIFYNGQVFENFVYIDTHAEICVKYSFKTAIDTVEIRYDTPEAGKAAPEVKIPEDAGYVLESAYWYDDDTGEEVTELLDGHSYGLCASLLPVSGCEFSEEAVVLVNGEATDDYWVVPEMAEIYGGVSFKKTIDTVELPAPPADLQAGDSLAVGLGTTDGPYTVVVEWSAMDDNMDEAALGDTAEAGKNYQWTATAIPNEGYAFAGDVTVTVGGKAVNTALYVETGNAIMVGELYLLGDVEMIHKVELTTTLPDVGETVGSAKVAEDAPYKLAQANWAVSESDDMMDAVEAPYEEGMKVWMAADLLAKEGYIFSPKLQVYVNGKPADTDFFNPFVYASGSVVYSPHEAALILLLDDESDDAGDDFIPGGGEGEADAPLTGDEGVVLYAVLAVVTLAGAVVLLLGKRRMA